MEANPFNHGNKNQISVIHTDVPAVFYLAAMVLVVFVILFNAMKEHVEKKR
jgi:hypothetical protein